MSYDRLSRPSRIEIATVLLLMVAMTGWYAWPQAVYSAYPLLDTILFFLQR